MFFFLPFLVSRCKKLDPLGKEQIIGWRSHDDKVNDGWWLTDKLPIISCWILEEIGGTHQQVLLDQLYV